MPDHTVDSCTGKGENIDEAHAQIRAACGVFAGKWKLEILWLLIQRVHRFNELRRAIPGVTQHMLTQQLRELESDGMVRRTVYLEIPPRVEYQITEDARRLKPVFEAILMWSHARRGDERGVENAAA